VFSKRVCLFPKIIFWEVGTTKQEYPFDKKGKSYERHLTKTKILSLVTDRIKKGKVEFC
jgi:hypothetical protein